MMMNSSRHPFTASQWQELEHQALIFKYMASGIPIPSDLILAIRRSLLLDSAASFPQTQCNQSRPQTLTFSPSSLTFGFAVGWSCFPMGFAKKAEDPEPGRCRRTDGKKWRCSKEAFPDSKYCERHMHRGKNRSRKPVEISLAARTNLSSSSSSSSSVQSPYLANLSMSTQETNWQLPYPASPWPNAQHGGDGMKELEGCGLKAMGKQNSYCLSKEEEEERQRTLLHFFDEWPQRNKDNPWMELDEENSSYNKTQLSISFPK